MIRNQTGNVSFCFKIKASTALLNKKQTKLQSVYITKPRPLPMLRTRCVIGWGSESQGLWGTWLAEGEWMEVMCVGITRQERELWTCSVDAALLLWVSVLREEAAATHRDLSLFKDPQPHDASPETQWDTHRSCYHGYLKVCSKLLTANQRTFFCVYRVSVFGDQFGF